MVGWLSGHARPVGCVISVGGLVGDREGEWVGE